MPTGEALKVAVASAVISTLDGAGPALVPVPTDGALEVRVKVPCKHLYSSILFFRRSAVHVFSPFVVLIYV